MREIRKKTCVGFRLAEVHQLDVLCVKKFEHKLVVVGRS